MAASNLVIFLSIVITISVDREPEPRAADHNGNRPAKLYFDSQVPGETTFLQHVDIGIFVTIKFTKKCEYKLLTLNNRKICVTSQPVLTVNDFAYITEIKKDPAGTYYFNLGFSDQGFIKLKKLSAAFPDTQLALVINNTIVGFIKNLDVLRNKTLKIDATSDGKTGLEAIHEKLLKALPVKNG